jgi:ATP-dependent helicase/nuclease subunit A
MRRLAWVPSVPPQDEPRLKTTVSALLRQEQGEAAYLPPSPWPLFLSQRLRPDLGLRDLDGAARGTAFHAAMRALDLAPLRGLHGEALRTELREQLDGLVRAERLREAERLSLREPEFEAFFASDIGQRLLASPLVKREWAFNLRMEVFGGLQLVQGVLDCCFLENDTWILLDFKTDADPDSEAVLARYTPQIAVYAEALKRITKTPVRLAALFLTKKGGLFPYPSIGNGDFDQE